MTHQVIIGGGPAATNAIEAIRQFDHGAAKITLICDEPAHSRMALPYWLSGQIAREQTYTGDANYFQQLDVDTRIGVRAASIDRANKSVQLADGGELTYDNLLLATGARPLKLPVDGGDLSRVTSQWSITDVEHGLEILEAKTNPRVVLIGAGFIGFIVLGALFKRGCQLTVIEREAHVLPKMLGTPAAKFVEQWLADKQVDVHTDTSVTEIRESADGARRIETSAGKSITADLVVVAIGVTPNLDLVRGTGIQTDHGILVNDRLQTNDPSIYAGGDCAQGPVLLNDTPQVHAIHPTAVDHGRVAGANMTGQDIAYPGSLSMNVLDVCGLQCVSYGNWGDAAAEPMEISSPATHVYRNLLWTGDHITGAMFVGQASDVGMLTDVGMVKGMMQTETSLGPWKDFLRKRPFDIRRAYIGSKVGEKLTKTMLLGRPATTRKFHFGDAKPTTKLTPHHASYVNTKQ